MICVREEIRDIDGKGEDGGDNKGGGVVRSCEGTEAKRQESCDKWMKYRLREGGYHKV